MPSSSSNSRCAYRTVCGTKHPQNEDCLYVYTRLVTDSMPHAECLPLSIETSVLLLAADGLGGHSDGQIASRFVAAELGARYHECTDSKCLETTLESINKSLFRAGESLHQAKPMGCTGAGVIFLKDVLLVFSVGDCSVFRFEQEGVSLLTAVDRAPSSTIKVTSSFGGVTTYEPLNPEINMLTPSSGRYLICTDGLSDVLSLDDIKQAAHLPLDEGVNLLMSQVLAKGATDDVSVIMVDWLCPDDNA